MFICDCGREYKFSSGLNKHKERCSKVKSIEHVDSASSIKVDSTVKNVKDNGKTGDGDDDDDDDDITKSTFFTFPLTQLQPTANFSKEDLEMLEKRKQARLKAIQQARIEEKQRVAAAAAAAAKKKETVVANGLKYTLQHTMSYDDKGNKHENRIHENIGNEEHNAAFNIKYVRSSASSQNQQVIDAVTAAANEYCSGHGIGCGGGSGGGGGGGGGGGEAATLVNSTTSNGTTVYTHPSRTISIVENGDDDMDESERIVTLEKMTYLVLALIQQNTKLQKENAIMKTIISKIEPLDSNIIHKIESAKDN
jgi:hypothetical protein